ncbi:MAG TPA: SIMPL domain-containing protein [Castellaniella sp.]|uniref:SIMPL domain-containing protein n=1 Tax=Castellaniella sp. TaxID=1955812 RepID=UPI002F2043EC
MVNHALSHRFLGWAFAASVALWMPNVSAQSVSPEPPPVATLSAEASADVAQDEVQITLAAEAVGASQQQVSKSLNERLQATMKLARGHAGIEAHSGAYRIWPATDRDGKVSEWRGHAEILLQSKDFPAASQLAADLASHMPVAGLSFSVSEARRSAEEQKLLGQAVAAFQQRAQALTKALGFEGYRLKTLDLNGSGRSPVSPSPRMMAMAASAGSVAVPLEGGRERVSVSLQGTVFLLPRKTATPQ